MICVMSALFLIILNTIEEGIPQMYKTTSLKEQKVLIEV